MRFLGWIDHDLDQEQSVLRALGAARGQDARDELGLGTIRDTLADLLFPGTSTIQRRARYFLFVQWCCELAAAKRDAGAIATELRRLEVRLIERLRWLGEGEGVIGLLKGEDLGRMPSEIYWNGLGVLGIRRIRGNRAQWAWTVAARRESTRHEATWEDGAIVHESGFDHSRPAPPKGFPEINSLDFELSPDEATYLRERLKRSSVDLGGAALRFNAFPTFLASRAKVTAEAAWDHPRASRLPQPARDLLGLAAAFSNLMDGATTLYNFRVAELMVGDGGDHRIRDRHARALAEWRNILPISEAELVLARLADLPELGALARHSVDGPLIAFVREWAELCLRGGNLAQSRRAVDAVSDREIYLKRANGTSRILFRKARDRWRGQSGGALDYRWPVIRRYLNDLAAA